MILLWLIGVLLAGGVVAALVTRFGVRMPRLVALGALCLDLLILIWAVSNEPITTKGWFLDLNIPWIPQFGISVHLAMDGLSLLLVLLTLALGILSLMGTWSEGEHAGFFYMNLLWTIAGVTGVFLALDLFLFYFFWEMMLVPMYFLIALWGQENRSRASMKFFVFTQVSGLFMLLAIVGLYFTHGASTGVYSFDYTVLSPTVADNATALVLASGFLIAFLVKLPAFPFHTWLPDAHTQAPTTASILLAGLLLKAGAYGLLRLVIPIFPQVSLAVSPIMLMLSVTGILYGAIMTFGQTDLKRLVAYTSVSHMGFVLLGIFSLNEFGFQGAIIMIICHAFSTGGLFILVGILQRRLKTRDLDRMGGLWPLAPRMGGAWLFFAMASLGLPGIGNFIGEFLVLLGAYSTNPPAAVVAAMGLVAGTIYALWMIHRIFFAKRKEEYHCLPRLMVPESVALAVMIAVLVWLGVHPQPVLDLSKQGVTNISKATQAVGVDNMEIRYDGGKVQMKVPDANR